MYEYIIPPRKTPQNDNEYFEILCQSVFQAGFSWEVVRGKWSDFRKAFHNFNIDKVAAMKGRELLSLLENPRIIRNAAKIAAVKENALLIQEIQQEYGSLRKFVCSLRKHSYEKRRKILAKNFRWIGPTGAFHFFWCVNEEVPEWEDRNR
jgi:DNA-3-methyladenine glycosylase I